MSFISLKTLSLTLPFSSSCLLKSSLEGDKICGLGCVISGWLSEEATPPRNNGIRTVHPSPWDILDLNQPSPGRAVPALPAGRGALASTGARI